MNLTYEEQERLAYISGDTQKAALLAAVIDAESDRDAAEDYFWRGSEECPECGACL